MPKESYYPDVKEPHIHIHKGGITFTDVGHSHRNLKKGDKIYAGVVNEVIDDLLERDNERATLLVGWIREYFEGRY